MKYCLTLFLIASCVFTYAQPKDSLTKEQKDSARIANLFSKASYPLIKSSKYSGVLPVTGIT